MYLATLVCPIAKQSFGAIDRLSSFSSSPWIRGAPHISDRIRSVVSRQLNVSPEKITDMARFGDDLGADSLDAVELTMALEDEFGCEIPDEIAKTMLTVGDARAFVEARAKT